MFFGVGYPKFYVYNSTGTLTYTFEFPNFVMTRDNQTPANRVELPDLINPFTKKIKKRFLGYRFVEIMRIGSKHYDGTIDQWLTYQSSDRTQSELFKLIKLLELQDDPDNTIIYTPHNDTESLLTFTQWEVNVIVTKWYYDSISGRMDSADIKIEGKDIVNTFKLPLPAISYIYDGITPHSYYDESTSQYVNYVPLLALSGQMGCYDGLPLLAKDWGMNIGGAGYYKVKAFPSSTSVTIEGAELYNLWNGKTSRKLTVWTICDSGTNSVIGEMNITNGASYVTLSGSDTVVTIPNTIHSPTDVLHYAYARI